MMGEGPSYRERQKGWVKCSECGEELAAGSLAGHMTTKHRRAAEEIWIWETSATGEEMWAYRIALPAKGGPCSCPVEG